MTAPLPPSVNTPPDAATLGPDAVAEALARVRDVVAARVVGQTQAIDEALVAVLARGHALVEGVPGTAKTLLVRALAGALGVRFGRVQFTPDLMPSDITGVSVLREDEAGRRFEFVPGPVFVDFLLADEINRAPAKTQAALLEAMAERQVTVDGRTRPLGEAFTVFATQNPVEFEGTFPLPEAQLDRFLLKISVGYPDAEAERAMLDHYESGFDAERATDAVPAPVLDTATRLAVRAAADAVTVAPEVRGYMVDVVRATRDEPGLTLGGSPRATVALFKVARAAAVLAGRTFVTPDDVKELAPAALRHRVILSPELEVERRTPDDVLSQVLDRVRAPR